MVIAATAAATTTTSGSTAATAATATKAAAATTTAAAVAAATTATAAEATASTTAEATAAAAAAAAATFSARLRLVHAQRTPIDVLAIERLDGTLCILLAFHLDERKATRTTGVPVEHDLHVGDLAAVAFERGAQGIFGGLEGEVSYVQSRTHRCLTITSPFALEAPVVKGARPQAQTNGEREPLRGSRSISKGQTNQSAPDEVAEAPNDPSPRILMQATSWNSVLPARPPAPRARPL